MSAKVVFISYSHDSAEHRERVLALSERLRDDGYDTRLDQYVNGTPAEKWPRWMLDRLDEASHVLVICTDELYLVPDMTIAVAREHVFELPHGNLDRVFLVFGYVPVDRHPYVELKLRRRASS